MYTAGFSTLEILIAFSVGILFLSSALMVSFGDPMHARQYHLDSGYAAALDTVLDSSALIAAHNHIQRVTSFVAQNWRANAFQENHGVYRHLPEVVDVSPCLKQLTETTEWNSLLRSREITMSTIVSSIRLARASGRDTCDPTPLFPHDWDTPALSGWETTPGDIAGVQSSIETATIDGALYGFMTTTNTVQSDDLWVIDLEDTTSPRVIRSLETGGALNSNGLTEMEIVRTPTGTYAYVIQNSSTNQLQVIDLSDPETLEASDILATISLSSFGVSPLGSDPIPRVLTYHDNRLYIGLHTTIGPEFLVFGVEHPESPAFMGAVPNSFDHSINDIAIVDTYAYLAIAPGSGSSVNELMILDVSANTPVNTRKGFNASSSPNDTEAATALYAIGNRLYLGRARVSNAAERSLYVFDISSTTSPVPLKSKRLPISTTSTLGTPRVIDIIVHGKVGFVLTTDSTAPFAVYDVLSDPSDFVRMAESCSHTLQLPKLTDITYRNGVVYAAQGNQASVYLLHDTPNICHS